MRKWGFKKRFCVFASIFLVVFIVISWCIYTVVQNFIENNNKITFYVPDGAPALACAKLLSEDTKDDGIEYSVVSANGIESHVTSRYESKNADFCVLPLTDANLLLKDGERYQALGVLTHGNFFMLSETEQSYGSENLSSLIGKKIGFVQLNKLPGMIFRSILQENGIAYETVSDLNSCRADVVNLINIPATSAVKGAGYDLFVMPDPAASIKVEKAGFYLAGSVQELYGAQGYAQAVIVAKRSVIEHEGEIVEQILEKLRTNNEWLSSSSVSSESVLSAIETHLEGTTPAFTQDNFAKEGWKEEITSRYGVYFTEGEAAKTEITQTVTRIGRVDSKIIAFSEDFFKA